MAGLTLSRRTGEGILIGDEVVVTVRHICGSTVILNVDAPGEIRILYQHLSRREMQDDAQDRLSDDS